MTTVQELIETIQQKIGEYRQTQKIAWRVRGCLRVGQQSLKESLQHLPASISKQIEELKLQASQRVSAVGGVCCNLLNRQRSAYQEQIYDLRSQISRQYKVINLLKQELEDLMMMINVQKQGDQQSASKSEYRGEETVGDSNVIEGQSQTINGLQIIQEQQTDRTVLSSTHSFTEEPRFPNSQNFIRIQEKMRGDYSDNQSNNQHLSSQSHLHTEGIYLNQQHHQEEWKSSCHFEQLLESEVSKRQITHPFQQNSEQCPSQWQSLPLSAQVVDHGEQLWDTPNSLNQLRQITNEVQHERQSKTKMFLQQFRKTFNKCLSSANVSRKGSRNMARPPKDKPKTMNATFGKLDSQNHQNNQKLITDMLKDLDNNNKFTVGSRRSELRYQGEKKEGVRSGQGVLLYSNGLSYEGEFKNNLRHGFGILKFNQIQIYKGQWAADQLSGQGKIRNFAVINKRKSQVTASPLSRWVSYAGSFRGNRFEGQGTLYLQGGEKFLGRFICGSACGQGTLYRKNGEVETGVWRHNQLAQQF